MSREVRLATVPEGLPRPEHFEVVTTPVPTPAAGEVLVRNRFFQVSARLRTLLSGAAEGTPLPSVRPGESPPSATVGEVVTAPQGSGLRPGDLVFHWLGWREHAVLPAEACVPLGDALPDPVAHLGSGWTAYTALTRYGGLVPGDTVLVTAGAGGVGSLAGQIARELGAGRVIGTTGSPEKADRMTADLGYDTVLVGGAPLTEEVDVVVDNVGGDHLRAAVAHARPGARIVLVGTLAAQLVPHLSGAVAPVELDAFQLVLKGITLRGFRDPGDPSAKAEWTERFGTWLRDGVITFPHVRVPGIDHAAEALHDVIGGKHVGTVVVEL